MSSLTENFGISVQIKANNAGQFVMMEDKSNLRGPMYWPAPDPNDQNYEESGSTGFGRLYVDFIIHSCQTPKNLNLRLIFARIFCMILLFQFSVCVLYNKNNRKFDFLIPFYFSKKFQFQKDSNQIFKFLFEHSSRSSFTFQLSLLLEFVRETL